jgi:ketosteroid isomerase-like protein
MSQENAEAFREMFAIFNDRGVRAATEAFQDLLAPDFRLEEAAELPDPGAFTGRDAFIANLAKLEESFEELRMEPQLWSLRDGEAVSLRDFATKAEALEAVGLSE